MSKRPESFRVEDVRDLLIGHPLLPQHDSQAMSTCVVLLDLLDTAPLHSFRIPPKFPAPARMIPDSSIPDCLFLIYLRTFGENYERHLALGWYQHLIQHLSEAYEQAHISFVGSSVSIASSEPSILCSIRLVLAEPTPAGQRTAGYFISGCRHWNGCRTRRYDSPNRGWWCALDGTE